MSVLVRRGSEGLKILAFFLMNMLLSISGPRTEFTRFNGFGGCGAGLSGDVGGTDSGTGRSSTSGLISVSTAGVSATNGEDFITAFDVAGFVPLQVKHNEAEPKTFLSHIRHLLNELDGSFVVVAPGPGVTGSFGKVEEGVVISVVDFWMNVSELSTFRELGHLDSRGSAVTAFCSALLLAGISEFDIVGRAPEGSGMLDEAAAGRRRGDRLADRSSVELRNSLGDGSGE
jgi:hypothetical protein